MIKLEVKTHDGETFIEEVESYDANQLNDKINDKEILTVVIGNRIISRIKISEISIFSK